MPNDELTRTQYLNALLSQKKQLQQSGQNIVNPSIGTQAGLDTTMQMGVDNTGVPTEGEIRQTTKENKNWFEQAWDNVTGFVDEIVAQTLSGFVGAFESVADLGATLIGGLGDATGWYDSDSFTEWAKQDIAGDFANWNKIYGLSFSGAENLLTGKWGSSSFRQDAFNGLNGDAERNYTGNSEVLQQMGGFGEFLGGAAHSIGFMLPSILIGGGNTPAVLSSMFISGAGEGAEQALKEGATTGEALTFGLASSAVETASEVVVGKLLGKVATKLGLDNIVKGFGKINGIAVSKELLGKASASQFVASMVEEGAEEVVSAVFAPFLETIYKKDKAFYDENGGNIFLNGSYIKDIGLSFLSGAFVSGLMGGAQNIRVANRYGKELTAFIHNNQTYNELLEEYEAKQFKGEKTTELENNIKTLAETMQSQLETVMNDPSETKHLRNFVLDYAKGSNSKIKKAEITNDFVKKASQTLKKDFSMSAYEKLTNRINDSLAQNNLKDKIVWASDEEIKNGLDIENVETFEGKNQEIRGFYVPSEHRIVLNEKYSESVGSLIKHELISHAVLDSDYATKKALIDFIESDKSLSKKFHEKDELLENNYSKEEISDERLATFLENYISNFESLNETLSGNATNKLKNILRKIKRVFTENKVDRKILSSVEKALESLKNPTVQEGNFRFEPAIQYSKVLKTEIARSPIPYQGNKFQLCEKMIEVFNNIPKEKSKRFIDLFGGSLTVSMNYKHSKKIANELNPMLFRLYELLLSKTPKERVESFKKVVEKYQVNTEAGFNFLKEKFNKAKDEDKPPLMLLLLTYYGTSGTYLNLDKKNNYIGNFSPANANFSWHLMEKKLRAFQKGLKNVKLTNKNAFDLLPTFKEGDLVYLDPPYSNTNAVYNKDWTLNDDKRLMEELDKLTERGVYFAMSDVLSYNGKENTHLEEWSKKYRVEHFEKKYRYGEADEVLICNFNTKGEIINVEKERREKPRQYLYDKNNIKSFVTQNDLGLYFKEEWKGFYEKASNPEREWLNKLYSGEISIFNKKGKENFKIFYDAINLIKNKAFDKESNLKYRYWTPEMKMLEAELRKLGVSKLRFVNDANFIGEFVGNEIKINLLAVSNIDEIVFQQVLRHERMHFLEQQYPELYNQFAKSILSKITPEIYKNLVATDSHGNDYAQVATLLINKGEEGRKLVEDAVKLMEKVLFKGIKLPFPENKALSVRFNNFMVLKEILADIYAGKENKIDNLRSVLNRKQINTITNALDDSLEKSAKIKIKFSKDITGEASTSTIKNAAIENVITYKDTYEVVDIVFDELKKSFPEMRLPDKTAFSKTTFKEFNLKNKKDQKEFILSILDKYFDLKQEFKYKDSVTKTEYNFEASVREMLSIHGYSDATIENTILNISDSFYALLSQRTKASVREYELTKLRLTITNLKNKIAEYKHTAQQTFRAYKRVCKIKEEIKQLSGLKKTGDTKVEDIDFINKMFDKGWFTSLGNFSGSVRKKAFELSLKGADGESYFDKLRQKLLTEGSVLPIEVIDFYEDLGKTYNPALKIQKTLNYDEILKFNTIINMVRTAYKEYVEGVYKDVVEIADEGVKEFSFSSSILAKDKKSFGYTFLKGVETVLNPLTVMEIAGNGTDFMENNLVNPLINAYDRKRLDQTNLLNSFRELVSTKTEIYKKSNKKVTYKGKRIARFNLYSLYLHLMCPYNGRSIIMNGFTAIESNKQKIVFEPSAQYRVKEGDTRSKAEIDLERYAYYEQARIEMANEIELLLTPNEIEELERISNFLNNGELKNYVREAQKEIDGFTTLIDERYYPMTIDDANQPVRVDKKQGASFLVDASNTGFLKNRIGSRTSVRLTNPIALMEAYIESICNYRQITKPLRKVQRIFNKKIIVNNKLTTIVNEISKYTPEFAEHFGSLQKKLLGMDVSKGGGEIWENLMGKYSTAVLGFNIGSALTQIASLPTASVVTGLRASLKSLLKKTTYDLKGNHDFLKEHSGIYAWRTSNHGFVKSLTTSSQFHQFSNQILNKATDVAMLGMEKLDQLWCLIEFGFCQQTIQDEMGLAIGTEKNRLEAVKLFNKVLLYTQSNSDPIAKSMLRSGELGKMTQYLFGVFASDAQSKISLFMSSILNWSRSKKLYNVSKRMIENGEFGEYGENFVRSVYERSRKQLSKYKKQLGRYIPTLIASGVLAMLAGLLRDILYGRKEIEEIFEDPFEELGVPLLLETFVEWIPFVGQFSSYLKYESLNIMPLQTVLAIAENAMKLFEGLQTGKMSNGAMTNLLIQIVELLGLPANNIKNIIMGLLNFTDVEGAIKTDNLLYGRSQAYFVKNYYTKVENNADKKAKAVLKEYLSSYKVEVDDVILKEMHELYSLKFEVLPKNTPYTYEENGREVAFSTYDILKFKAIYEMANKDARDLLEITEYRNSTQELRAKLLKKIYNAYYEVAYHKIRPTQELSRIAKLVNESGGQVSIAKYLVALENIAKISENKAFSRKELVFKYVNSLTNFSKAEKIKLLELAGYKIK
jgi:site-specific DNA-adenine methylase